MIYGTVWDGKSTGDDERECDAATESECLTDDAKRVYTEYRTYKRDDPGMPTGRAHNRGLAQMAQCIQRIPFSALWLFWYD